MLPVDWVSAVVVVKHRQMAKLVATFFAPVNLSHPNLQHPDGDASGAASVIFVVKNIGSWKADGHSHGPDDGGHAHDSEAAQDGASRPGPPSS